MYDVGSRNTTEALQASTEQPSGVLTACCTLAPAESKKILLGQLQERPFAHFLSMWNTQSEKHRNCKKSKHDCNSGQIFWQLYVQSLQDKHDSDENREGGQMKCCVGITIWHIHTQTTWRQLIKEPVQQQQHISWYGGSGNVLPVLMNRPFQPCTRHLSNPTWSMLHKPGPHN